jgi:outer membrane murein-binding lipoprotein Lpp
MNENLAGQILTEVRSLGDRLDAKIDGLDAKANGLDAKIDRVHEDMLWRFDQLHVATEYTYDRLAVKVDALQAEIVRRPRKRR